MSVPPPLPPRLPPDRPPSYRSTGSGSSRSSVDGDSATLPRTGTIHLTPYTVRPPGDGKVSDTHPYSGGTGLDDPRSSSTQSLQPVRSADPSQRKLLLIYIHGFMGAETSFQSFPAHVHNLLSMTLSDTHVVHTKIYPRYQSRRNISFARDAFSNWLTPHEGDNVDVILLGHSLGGILASEVILLPSHRPGSNDLFQHRILGQIAFDVPFLGMHPGVVGTGIASLFKATPDLPQSTSEFPDLPTDDPNYNPAYPNDINIPIRNKLEKARRFINKHYGDLSKATSSYFKSYLEFGGCLADYQGLNKRHDAITALEDVNELAGQKAANGRPLPRVRFVNYYTASTGRIKHAAADKDKTLMAETEMSDMSGRRDQSPALSSAASNTPRISLEEHVGDTVVTKSVEHLDLDDESNDGTHQELQLIDPTPTDDLEDPISTITDPPALTPASTTTTEPPSLTPATTSSSLGTPSSELPPIPVEPDPPPHLDTTLYTDPSALKLAQQSHARQQKAYTQALKDRDKAIKERDKFLAKRQKAAQRAEEKRVKQEQQDAKNARNERKKRQATLNQDVWDRALERNYDAHNESRTPTTVSSTDISRVASAGASSTTTAPSDIPQDTPKQRRAQKLRDRKFCTLPSKDQRTGKRDRTWVRVYMEGMDEVVAHTSLFNPGTGETYAKLVGDTVGRIEDWVREDVNVRACKAAMHDID